jgi:hypothetical protein
VTDITGFKKDIVSSYIPKDPDSELTYTVDWTDWMPTGSTLDTLTPPVVTVSTISGDADPLVKVGSGIVTSTEKVYVTLSGGTAGEIYTVKVTITTDNGDIDVRRFRVKVEERYI